MATLASTRPASVRDTLANALIVTRREVRDSFRDWRILVPILVLTFLFPALAQFIAGKFTAFVTGYGADIVGERIQRLAVAGVHALKVTLHRQQHHKHQNVGKQRQPTQYQHQLVAGAKVQKALFQFVHYPASDIRSCAWWVSPNTLALRISTVKPASAMRLRRVSKVAKLSASTFICSWPVSAL